MKFKHDYVDFAGDQIKRVGCMCCNQTVASLDEKPSDRFTGKTLMVLKRHANWKQRRVELSDGTYAEIIVCSDCQYEQLDGHEGDIASQIKGAWEKELKAHGRPNENIDDHKKRVKDLKVLTKEEKRARKL